MWYVPVEELLQPLPLFVAEGKMAVAEGKMAAAAAGEEQ